MLMGVFKSVGEFVFSFDIEWVPDAEAARRLFGISIETRQGLEDAFQALWKAAGADQDRPQPYLKTMLCRMVSLCGILRERRRDGSVELKLVRLPSPSMEGKPDAERLILEAFLKSVGKRKYQLVGYNSQQADLPIVVQRSIAHGLPGYGFTDRPGKPWEGHDYFSPSSDDHIDLAPLLGRYQQMPSLHEAAVVSGIPGKIDASGGSVAEMWLAGNHVGIIDYNECDAFTTHLLWARIAHFGGHLSGHAYREEQLRVRDLLGAEIALGKTHLQAFLEKWASLRGGFGDLD